MKKKCTKCSINKSISKFHRQRFGKYGVRSQCKQCCIRANKKYYVINKNQILKRYKKYYSTNKNQILNGHKKYLNTKVGREARKRTHRKYDKSEKGKRAHKKYRQSEKGKLSSARDIFNRRNKNVRNDLTSKQWKEILRLQNNRCNGCNKKFTQTRKATKDHIIPMSRGGGLTQRNIQALCQTCNSRKGTTANLLNK